MYIKCNRQIQYSFVNYYYLFIIFYSAVKVRFCCFLFSLLLPPSSLTLMVHFPDLNVRHLIQWTYCCQFSGVEKSGRYRYQVYQPTNPYPFEPIIFSVSSTQTGRKYKPLGLKKKEVEKEIENNIRISQSQRNNI